MASSNPATVRSRALGALAVLVLALLISLALFVGRGGCTSAVAFDRPPDDAAGPADFEREIAPQLAGAPGDAGPDLYASRSKRDAAAVALGPVRGIVRDDVTHEIVPFVEVELALGDRVELIAVGADGRFASPADFPSGQIVATVRDEGAEVSRSEILHEAARGTTDWSVEVPIGPTISLTSIDDRPIRAEAWRARIVESALAPEIVGELDVLESALVMRAPSGARPDREWSWRTLRPGNRPWIRYPRREHAPAVGVRAALELRDDVANRRGVAPLRATIGIHPAVEVDSVAFAKMRLRLVRAPEHEKLPMRVVVYDTRDEPLAGVLTAPVFDEGVVDDQGEIEFTDLEGGTKHVVGWSREERVDHHLVVSEGPSDFVPVPAKRTELCADGRVVNRELPWFAADRLYVVAKPAAAEDRMRGWLAKGEVENRFLREVIDTALGGIEGRVVLGDFLSSHFRESPTYQLAAYRFEAGPRTGAEILFGPSGSLFPSGGWSAERPLVLLERTDFSWSAWSEGQQPLFGSQVGDVDGTDETRRIELRFDPGWGAQIVLRAGSPNDIVDEPAMWSLERPRRQGRVQERAKAPSDAAVLAAPPVPGVTLRIDGLDEGLSDAVGELRIRRPFRPDRLTLVGRGWRLTALEKLPGTAPRYVAWLRRNP